MGKFYDSTRPKLKKACGIHERPSSPRVSFWLESRDAFSKPCPSCRLELSRTSGAHICVSTKESLLGRHAQEWSCSGKATSCISTRECTRDETKLHILGNSPFRTCSLSKATRAKKCKHLCCGGVRMTLDLRIRENPQMK